MEKTLKLQLSKETLRKLDEAQAKHVEGGASRFCWLPSTMSFLRNCPTE